MPNFFLKECEKWDRLRRAACPAASDGSFFYGSYILSLRLIIPTYLIFRISAAVQILLYLKGKRQLHSTGQKPLNCMKYIFIIALLLSGCTSLIDKDLNEFVAAQMQNSKSGVLDFRRFDYKGWNKMYILTPYAAAAGFDATLLKAQNEILDTGIGESDTFFLIVLAKNERVVRIAKFASSGLGQLAIINRKFGFYPKSTAVFDYRERDNLLSVNSKETQFRHFSSPWPKPAGLNIK